MGKAFAIASVTIEALQTEITIIGKTSDIGSWGWVADIEAAAGVE